MKYFRILLAALSFSFVVPSAYGYSYLKGNPRWPFSSMPIPWYISLNKTSNWYGRTKKQLRAMALSAFRLWEEVDCSFLMFRYMGTTTVGAIKGDGKNVIEWVNTLPGSPKPGAIGLGGPLFRRGGEIYEGNVWIKAMRRPDKFISVVIAHEVGHAVGFGHSEVKGSIMYPSSSYSTTLSQDDIKLICNAYPSNVNTCTENSHCPNGLICRGGKCVKCRDDGDCDSGYYCDRDVCVEFCKSDADCKPAGMLCDNGKCRSCQKDEECGDSKFCDEGLCKDKCRADDDCQAEEECRENGRCLPRGSCLKDEECKKGEICVDNKCKSLGKLGKVCQGAADCDEGQDCLGHDCSEDLDCLEGYVCKKDGGDTGTCVEKKSDNFVSICAVKCSSSDRGSCPEGFYCKPFSKTESYCFPKKRTPPPPPQPKKNLDNGGDKGEGGCGCQLTPLSPAGGELPLVLILALLSVLFVRRKSF